MRRGVVFLLERAILFPVHFLKEVSYGGARFAGE